jgi:hypothetical protein
LSITNHFDFVAGGGLLPKVPTTNKGSHGGSLWPYLDAYRILIDDNESLKEQRSCIREWFRTTPLRQGGCSSQQPPLSSQ